MVAVCEDEAWADETEILMGSKKLPPLSCVQYSNQYIPEQDFLSSFAVATQRMLQDYVFDECLL